MKKSICVLVLIALFCCLLFGCGRADRENPNEGIGEPTTVPTQIPETTNAASLYRPGQWTTGGYTSEWLNMLYDRPWVWEITSDSIAISKEFDAIRAAEDPYFAVTEMRFNSPHKNGNASAGSIALLVELMKNGDQTVKAYADEDERQLQAEYEKLGAKREILAKGEEEIVFLGEKYFVRYTKTNVLGKDWETCTLYLIKDNHGVRLTNQHLSDHFDIANTFKGFSALDGENYSSSCGVCGQEVSYKIVSEDTPMCLRCCFNNQGIQQPEQNQTVPKETVPKETVPKETATTIPTMPPAPTVISCNHSFKDATCVAPKTCTMCGTTEGSAAGHRWSAASCTTPQTCTVCGATTGNAAGHKWKEATCTEAACCTVCQKTSGEPKGHSMNATKCTDCNHSDFSRFAKHYTKVSAYDSKTGADYEVTDVSVTSSGVLTFTFKEKTYSVTMEQTQADYWEAAFSCSQNGVLLPDARARVTLLGENDYCFHFNWDYLEGCKLYFFARP